MAVIGFLLYGLLGYGIYSSVHTTREQAYDSFVLAFVNGSVIAETFTNDASICGWAIGVLNYKEIPRTEWKNVTLKPTKTTEKPHRTYTQWCKIDPPF